MNMRWLLAWNVFMGQTQSPQPFIWKNLSNIFHWYAQFCIYNILLLSTEAEAFAQLTIKNKEVSSAKNLMSDEVLMFNHWYIWEKNKDSKSLV